MATIVCSGLMRPGIVPSCGPLASSRMASGKRAPVRAGGQAAGHGGVVDQVEGAELVVVAPASPVGDLGGEGAGARAAVPCARCLADYCDAASR